jgi:hypothetical protein
MGRVLLSAELLFQCPEVVVAPQSAVLVHVNAPRQPLLPTDLQQIAQVAGAALLVYEVSSRKQLVGRVVDGSHEAQTRALIPPGRP